MITTQSIPASTMIKRMLIGAAIGFFVISFFVFGVDTPDPSWPVNWRIRPLVITPVMTALGAGFSCFLDHIRYEGGWKGLAAVIVSLLVFVIALWMGSILGLVGTMWD